MQNNTNRFFYDVHLHTSESSACAKSSGVEMARAYLQNGYTGIIVTDHFFNGNSSAPKNIPWEDRIDILTSGYRAAKDYGDMHGLDVFFAWEASSDGNDFLTYGLDVDWLLKHPDVDKLPIREYLKFCRSEGAIIVHAHPFRQDFYIPMIRLLPDLTDAVEIMNAQRTFLENSRARWYAESYDFPMTAGSDAHHVSMLKHSGVFLPYRISSVSDYMSILMNRQIIIASNP